jgi:polyhydroxybutyrate depolymerase
MNKGRQCGGWSTLYTVYTLLVAAIAIAITYIYINFSYDGAYLEAQAFAYPSSYLPAEHCRTLNGLAVDHQSERSDQKILFTVTTPANYRSDYPHPLLVVWAPSGFNAGLSERFTGLTGPGTARGYIVVHVASVPLGLRALARLGAVPELVMKKWCVAQNSVFYTGHSDGGTVSNALAVITERSISPAAIAPSAMGMKGEDMATFSCPSSTNIMLMHNLSDGHFPGYGSGVADWWARCNQCGQSRPSAEHPDCIEYSGCAGGVRTLFCQADGNHAYWPGLHHDALEFFDERKTSGQAKNGDAF